MINGLMDKRNCTNTSELERL